MIKDVKLYTYDLEYRIKFFLTTGSQITLCLYSDDTIMKTVVNILDFVKVLMEMEYENERTNKNGQWKYP